MTDAEKFRYGFLLRCVDEGLDVPAAEKRAACMLKSAFDWGTLGTVGAVAAALPIGMAGVVGYQAGRGLGRADNDYTARESLESEEKIALYRRMAEKLKRERAMSMAVPAPRKMY